MSKKQKPGTSHSIRWDLAKGGTNLMMPLGAKVEPWPRWLSKSFVNVHVLQEDAISLREDLLGSGRDRHGRWQLIGNLLYAIESDAKKVLKEEPSRSRLKKLVLLPEGYTPLETIITEKAYSNYLTEDEFLNLPYESLTPKQVNAIASLRSVLTIRREYFYTDKHGFDHPYKEVDPTVATMLLEMMLLVMAAIRGEHWEELWPHIERGSSSMQHLREASSAGVAKRKSKSNKMAELCRRIATESTRKSVRGKAYYVLEKLKKQRKRRPPSLRTIQEWLGQK